MYEAVQVAESAVAQVQVIDALSCDTCLIDALIGASRTVCANILFEEYCRRYPRSLPSGARRTSRRSSQAEARKIWRAARGKGSAAGTVVFERTMGATGSG
jgi:hypothetical protein